MENKKLYEEVTKKVIQAVRQGKNREVVQKITNKKIPEETPPEDYTWQQRRAEIYQIIKRKGYGSTLITVQKTRKRRQGGDTLIASDQLQPKARLIELSPKHAQVILDHWERYRENKELPKEYKAKKITNKKIHVKADGYTSQNGGNRLYKHRKTVLDKTGSKTAEDYTDLELQRMYSEEIKHAYLNALYDEIKLSVEPETYKELVSNVENLDYNNFLEYGLYVCIGGEIELRRKDKATTTIDLEPHNIDIDSDKITLSTRLGELKLTKKTKEA